MVAVLNTELGKRLARLDHRFRLALVGYLILTFGMVLGLYYVGRYQSIQLRDDVNTVARLGCYAGRENVRKFNSFVDEIILTRQQTAQIHEAAGQIADARADRDAIRRYRLSKLHVATDAECDRKLLPPLQPPQRKGKP